MNIGCVEAIRICAIGLDLQETSIINPHVQEILNYKFKISNISRLV